MKDKLKGLLLGLLIGSLLTGTAAFAANSKTIQVYFKELRYIVDGVEKPSGSGAIIYQNTTYLPVRAFGNMMDKEVHYDAAASTIWIGAAKGQEALALYQGGSITKNELEQYLAFNSFYFGLPTPANIEQPLKELIALKLLSAAAGTSFNQEGTAAAEASFKQIQQYFGTPEQLTEQLAKAQLNETKLKHYIKQQFLVGKALEAKLSDADFKAEYDRQRQADSAAFTTADVRHILIAFADHATGEALRTDKEALELAQTTRNKLEAGENFAALAKELSDDPGSKAAGGLYSNAELVQFVTEFKKAAAELPLNQISEPIKTSYGYHILKVESRTIKPLSQVKEPLKQTLINQAYTSFFNNELPELITSMKLPVAN